jgi:hypothetical protein
MVQSLSDNYSSELMTYSDRLQAKNRIKKYVNKLNPSIFKIEELHNYVSAINESSGFEQSEFHHLDKKRSCDVKKGQEENLAKEEIFFMVNSVLTTIPLEHCNFISKYGADIYRIEMPIKKSFNDYNQVDDA